MTALHRVGAAAMLAMTLAHPLPGQVAREPVDLKVIEQIRELMEKWLQPMGLRLKPAKTRITHTLDNSGEQPGFDFLGFNIRQYPKGKAGLKDRKTS